MSQLYDDLPRHIPDGTRYVVEGEPVPGGSRIIAAYLIFPDGQRLDLPADSTRIITCACARAARPGEPRRTEKAEAAAASVKRKLTRKTSPALAAKRARAG